MLFAATGHSEDIDTDSVLEEIFEQCEEELAGRMPKAGLLFSCIEAEHAELLEGIHQKWPDIDLVGCTTDGELSSRLGFAEDSVSLMLLGSDTVDIAAGIGMNVNEDIGAACQEAVKSAKSKIDQEPSLCIALPEGLNTDGHNIVDILHKTLGVDIPLFGATSGDQWQFQQTFQFFGTKVVSNALPVLMFSGPLTFSFGVASGWKAIGQPAQISRSEGPTVVEIDGEPAIEYYRRFLGADAKPSGECPLAILDDAGQMEYLRTSPGIFDESSGTITYVGAVPQGRTVQLTVADRDAILGGCRKSVEMALEGFPKDRVPDAALFFSCCARKLLLGTRTEEEPKIADEILSKKIPMAGFYGYGEIGPYSGASNDVRFHNETFFALLLGG